MRADCFGFSTETGRRAAVIADRPADVARLSRFLNEAELAYCGDLSGFAPRRHESAADLALVHISGDLGPAHWVQIEMLTRSLMLIVTGDAGAREAAHRLSSARAWSFVSEADLAPEMLRDVISGLARARNSEDRLLRRLADHEARINRLASAANLIPPVLGRVEEAIWGLAGLACSGTVASDTGDSAARAFDVVDELQLLNEEFAECVKTADLACQSPRVADLNRIVEDFVAAGASAGVGKFSAQTGCDPILVKSPAAALRHLLETLLKAWRETGHPGDRLELLTWDAGAEARLAVVLTRSASDAVAAPAFIAMRNIFRKLHPMAQACGADVEAGFGSAGKSDAASMTICLPKQPPLLVRAAATARHDFLAPRVTDRAE